MTPKFEVPSENFRLSQTPFASDLQSFPVIYVQGAVYCLHAQLRINPYSQVSRLPSLVFGPSFPFLNSLPHHLIPKQTFRIRKIVIPKVESGIEY